jgi:hypothetical protein
MNLTSLLNPGIFIVHCFLFVDGNWTKGSESIRNRISQYSQKKKKKKEKKKEILYAFTNNNHHKTRK